MHTVFWNDWIIVSKGLSLCGSTHKGYHALLPLPRRLAVGDFLYKVREQNGNGAWMSIHTWLYMHSSSTGCAYTGKNRMWKFCPHNCTSLFAVLNNWYVQAFAVHRGSLISNLTRIASSFNLSKCFALYHGLHLRSLKVLLYHCTLRFALSSYDSRPWWVQGKRLHPWLLKKFAYCMCRGLWHVIDLR